MQLLKVGACTFRQSGVRKPSIQGVNVELAFCENSECMLIRSYHVSKIKFLNFRFLSAFL